MLGTTFIYVFILLLNIFGLVIWNKRKKGRKEGREEKKRIRCRPKLFLYHPQSNNNKIDVQFW